LGSGSNIFDPRSRWQLSKQAARQAALPTKPPTHYTHARTYMGLENLRPAFIPKSFLKKFPQKRFLKRKKYSVNV